MMRGGQPTVVSLVSAHGCLNIMALNWDIYMYIKCYVCIEAIQKCIYGMRFFVLVVFLERYASLHDCCDDNETLTFY